MYCLEKLQRELAYFFDMDLRELPRVQDLLKQKGYTQVQKGDEIIRLEPIAQAESTLSAKTTSKLTKDELDNLPIATPQEYGEFLEKIAQKDYQNTPEILKIATLNNDLQELINNNHSANVFITRARAGHISEARKGEYDQALTLDEQKQIPAVIAQAKEAYTDEKSGFILPFDDKNNSEKINLIILDSDSKGNFLITAKKVNSAELDNPKYKKLARAGVEPATTTPPKAEQKPTEAISLARDEIIPQTQMHKDNSDPAKTFEYFRDDLIKEYPKALESTPPKDAPTQPTQKGLFDEVDSTLAYTDTKGHTHQIPSDIAQKWLETFGLKDLQESYTPKFSEQVAKALEPILQGEQITLSANSLVKLVQRERTEFLPYIKDTLEHSDIIIKDKENALIFAKDIGQTSYFTSVSKNDKGEWVISTNSYKTLSQLKNRVSENGEVIYLSKEAPNILAETFTTKAFSNELASDIIPQSTQEKPKWSRAEHKKWKLAKLEQTKGAAQKLYEQLMPIYNKHRPLLIKAKELKSTAKAKELQDKAWKLIEQESKPFIKELEQHELELDRTAFTLYPETASIKIQPKSNFDLEWKNKKRGAQGLKGAAKYRAQALQRLSEKDYMTPFEQATKASNPLTQLHALKFEILKDLHKAKLYINQQDYDKDLYKTYLGYVNRTSSELDSIEQSIRELKNSIVPKPQRVEQMRNKVQDFIKWRDEVRFDTDYLLALESDGVKHALEYLERQLEAATLPQQRNFIHQLKEQIKEHFPTPPTPPSPQAQHHRHKKGLFDEVDSSLSQEIKDIIDTSPAKGRDMQIIGEANFTPQVVEYAHKNSKKVAIDKLDKAEAERLGFKHPQDVRVTIDYQAINHTLNRHGADSSLVKESGQKAVDYNDIAEYRSIVKSADESLDSVDNLGQEVIVSFKQINGHAVVVESIRKKGNELAFKSMYFENGNYKNSNAYKNAVDSQKANPSPAPYGYEPHADANTPPLKTDTAIIPQTEISNIKKQLVELKESKSAYQKVLKALERNMKDVELEERRYLRGEESIKVFERKRLIQSSIDEHTQSLNAVLKKMIELHKQLPENVRYTKEVLDDLTKIEAILKGNNYSLEQALRLSKITQRLQEKAIIESESFLNKVYNLDDFAKGAKSLEGTSYGYNTDDTIRKYFKIIAEMIDSIPAFKKISANQPETPPKVDSSVESTPPKDTQTQPTQKGLFDEVDSSVEPHTKHQDYNTFNQA